MEKNNNDIISRSQLRLSGYDFNAVGELREFDLNLLQLTERKFQYDKYNGDKKRNEAAYHQIGNAITRYIYRVLNTEMKFVIYAPNDLQMFVCLCITVNKINETPFITRKKLYLLSNGQAQ